MYTFTTGRRITNSRRRAGRKRIVGLASIHSNLRRFAYDEGGGPTVEFVIWVMSFIWMVAFFLDLSLYFNTRTDMMRAVREAARYVAVGALQPGDVGTYIEQAIGRNVSYSYAISGTGTVSLEANVPTRDATIFGIINLLGQEFIAFNTLVRREIDSENVETGTIELIGSS